ncbi:hypothetical protein DN748_04335 [Sinomicrobium soli]|nr:hypothetical protein DN748_04335 [Sinomicrobium sp. N-1-3-6]
MQNYNYIFDFQKFEIFLFKTKYMPGFTVYGYFYICLIKATDFVGFPEYFNTGLTTVIYPERI